MRWRCGNQSLSDLIVKRTAAFLTDRARNPNVNVRQRIAEYIRRMLAYARELNAPPDPRWKGVPPLTAILLSYLRPENIPWMTASFLRLPYVARIWVLNNNPSVRLNSHVGEMDDRVVVENFLQRQPVSVRIHRAVKTDASYFAVIDDDLFLTASQIHALFGQLRSSPDVPHGIVGERIIMNPEFRLQRIMPTQEDEPVDVLVRCYFFTRELALQFRALQAWAEANEFDTPFADDILLSFSGAERPRVHHVGPWVNCLSGTHSKIATFRLVDGFEQTRNRIIHTLWERTGRASCWGERLTGLPGAFSFIHEQAL